MTDVECVTVQSEAEHVRVEVRTLQGDAAILLTPTQAVSLASSLIRNANKVMR